jgi:hypothetical protein
MPLIDTVDDAKAATMCGMFQLYLPVRDPTIYAVRWRAGRNSIVQNLKYDRPIWHPDGPVLWYPAVRIEGSGGGRWYNWTGLTRWKTGPGHRDILVDGTREPLRFYHLQPQWSCGETLIEIRSAHNVDIYSTKSECDYSLIWIRNSRNVRLFSHSGQTAPAPGFPSILIENSEDVMLANIHPQYGKINSYTGQLIKFSPKRWNLMVHGSFTIPGTDRFALYQIGWPAPVW